MKATNCVSLEVPSQGQYRVGAGVWVIQIGEVDWPASLDGSLTTLRVWFGDEAFAQINDGEMMVAKYSLGDASNMRIVLGPLNKGLLR